VNHLVFHLRDVHPLRVVDSIEHSGKSIKVFGYDVDVPADLRHTSPNASHIVEQTGNDTNLDSSAFKTICTDSGYVSAGGKSLLKGDNLKTVNHQSSIGIIDDDTRTRYSSAASITPNTLQAYIQWFAQDIYEKVSSMGICGTALDKISRILPELLKAFALKSGHNPSIQQHRDVMYFVHKYRK
jgi:hypothetical protein